MNSRCLRGLSLIEVLVVLAVMGIVAAVAAPSFTDLLNRRRVQSVAANIGTDLAYARVEAGLRPRQIGVWFNVNASLSCYTVFTTTGVTMCDCTNASGSCSGLTVEEKTERLDRSLNVYYQTSGTWGNNFASVLSFARPTPLPIPSDFAVDICGSTRANPQPVLRVQMNAMGRVNTCSPNSSMSGYSACVPAVAPNC